MKAYHEIKNLRFEGTSLVLDLDGREARFNVKEISPLLEKASEEERSNYEISPSGYGIRWPMIDEDLSVDSLLGIVHRPGIRRKSA